MLHHTKKLAMIILAISWLPSSVEADSHLHQINIKFGQAFERTMVHWRYDYNKLDGTKAGVACVQWSRIDQTFLEEGIFEAIGFSYSMAKEEAAIRTAHQGCEQMARHYDVSGCTCQIILVDDDVRITIPDDITIEPLID